MKRGATNMALSRFDESIDDYRKMLKQQEGFDAPEKHAAGLLPWQRPCFSPIALRRWRSASMKLSKQLNGLAVRSCAWTRWG